MELTDEMCEEIRDNMEKRETLKGINLKKLRLFKIEVYQNFRTQEESVKAMHKKMQKGKFVTISEEQQTYFQYNKAIIAQETMDKVWKILNLEES